jgi:hypothetical protein
MISSLITPPVYDIQGTPDPTFVYGEPLVTYGLENAGSAVNGFGLLTRGLIWQVLDIWFDVDYYNSNTVVNTWSSPQDISPITTTWTNPQYGMLGPYPTI